MDYKSLSIDDLLRECIERPCPEAWLEFHRRFHRLIASVVVKACREWGVTAPDVIEDLIQETYLKLYTDNCRVLRRFKPRHPNAFLGYLKVVTANLVYDHFRKIKPEDDKTFDLNEEICHLEPSAGSMDSTEMEIWMKEVNEILLRRGNGPAEKKERAIFWLYYRHGFTAQEIASIPGLKLSVKGVESTIHRLTVYVKRALTEREDEQGEAGIAAS